MYKKISYVPVFFLSIAILYVLIWYELNILIAFSLVAFVQAYKRIFRGSTFSEYHKNMYRVAVVVCAMLYVLLAYLFSHNPHLVIGMEAISIAVLALNMGYTPKTYTKKTMEVEQKDDFF